MRCEFYQLDAEDGEGQDKARVAITSERNREVDNHAGVIADLLVTHAESKEAHLRPAWVTGSASSSAFVLDCNRHQDTDQQRIL